MFRLWRVGVLTIAVTLGLTGCTQDGDAYAASLAERIIVGIGDDITPAYPKPLEADYLAAWAIESPRLPHDGASADFVVDVLDWEGNSGDEAGARIEFRIGVQVHQTSSDLFGGRGYREGQSTRCWELTIFGFHDYDSLTSREFTCPEGAVAKHPTPMELPAFPDDVDARLAQAITGATAADIDARVLAEFPDDFYTIESESANGELAVALGIPAEFECAVGAIHADGSVEVIRGFQKVQLQPGETGCSPSLYFRPITTH